MGRNIRWGPGVKDAAKCSYPVPAEKPRRRRRRKRSRRRSIPRLQPALPKLVLRVISKIKDRGQKLPPLPPTPCLRPLLGDFDVPYLNLNDQPAANLTSVQPRTKGILKPWKDPIIKFPLPDVSKYSNDPETTIEEDLKAAQGHEARLGAAEYQGKGDLADDSFEELCLVEESEQGWSLAPGSERIEASRASLTMSVRASISIPVSKLMSFIVQMFLYGFGDVRPSLESTKRVLDELLTDFITEMCFEAQRSAQLAGRQKIKVDDVKFACRKNPRFLGKIEEVHQNKDEIDKARKTLDVNDDKITKSNVKAMEEEPLGDLDDDMDVDVVSTVGGKSSRKGR